MSGFFGSEVHQRLQAAAEANAGQVKVTPGACQSGRFLGCDDPDRFGWEVIDSILERDGIFGFRMVPAARANELAARFAERGFRLDLWDVFTAERSDALPVSEAIVSQGLHDELRDLETPTEPESAYTRSIQQLIADEGIVPFSGSMLVGQLGPATTVAVGDNTGRVVAAAHGYLPHNAFSPYHRHAWGGLVAVATSLRGRGLGRYINARMVVSVFHDIDADHIYELVTATNAPSRRMVEACGLHLDPNVVCGLAVRSDGGRFTR